MPPTEIVADDSAIGVMCNDVIGEGWGSFRIAHMSTGDKIGVEIFEFKNAEKRENNFEYWKTGVFHFCVQDPDVEGLAAKIVENGGKQRMPIREYYPGEKPYRMVYCEDPFGYPTLRRPFGNQKVFGNHQRCIIGQMGRQFLWIMILL